MNRRQHGFTILIYLGLALAVLAAVGGIIWWANENIETRAGVRKGEASKQSEWDAANAAAIVKAETERARQEQLQRDQAKTLEAALTKARRVSNVIRTRTETHISAIPAPPRGCPEPRLTDSLFDDWNRANRGSEDASPGVVLGAGRVAADAGRPEPAKPDPQPSGGSR